jgi:hypothetical protein
VCPLTKEHTHSSSKDSEREQKFQRNSDDLDHHLSFSMELIDPSLMGTEGPAVGSSNQLLNSVGMGRSVASDLTDMFSVDSADSRDPISFLSAALALPIPSVDPTAINESSCPWPSDVVLERLQEFLGVAEHSQQTGKNKSVMLGSSGLSLQVLTSVLELFPDNVEIIRVAAELLPHVLPCCESLKSFMAAVCLLPCKEPQVLAQKLHILRMLRQCILAEQPSTIELAGDKESFVGVMCAAMSVSSGLSLALWVRIEANSASTNKGFLLCRCRTSDGGLDCILSDPQMVAAPQGSDQGKASTVRWTVTVRGYNEQKSSGQTQKIECKGSLSIRSNTWTHVVLTHSPVGSGQAASGHSSAVGDPRTNPGTVSIFVDGRKDLDHAFPSPFAHNSAVSSSSSNASVATHHAPQQVQWAVGVGLKGSIASLVAYSCALSTPLIMQLMHSTIPSLCGPGGPSGVGIAVPQSSFDSGYMSLSSRATKGPQAAELARMPLAVSLSPRHFVNVTQSTSSGSSGAGSSSGSGAASITSSGCPCAGLVVGGENIEFVPVTASTEAPLTLSLAPSASLNITTHHLDDSSGWRLTWLQAGGVALLLYMLQADLFDEGEKAKTKKLETRDSENISHLAVAKYYIRLLTALVGVCVDLREQLLQIHGLHLLGHILASRFSSPCFNAAAGVSKEERHDKDDSKFLCILDVEFVRDCYSLLQCGSGPCDRERGDYASACYQGLLLNMNLWGSAGAAVKAELLTAILTATVELNETDIAISNYLCDSSAATKGAVGDAESGAFLNNVGDELRRAIGVQALIDILRLYFLPFRDADHNISGSVEDLAFYDTEESMTGHPCYALSLTLLTQVMEACTDPNSPQRSDPRALNAHIYAILSALDSCRGPAMLMVLTKVLVQLRRSVPIVLLQVLVEHRFADTTALDILTYRYSAQHSRGMCCVPGIVRKEILALCLWLISEPTHNTPQSGPQSQNTSANASISAQLLSIRKKLVQLENNKMAASNQGIIVSYKAEVTSLLKIMRKSWQTLSMLGEALTRAIQDKEARDSETLNEYWPSWGGGDNRIAAANECLGIFFDDCSVNSRFDVWLALPLLPPLLSICDLDVFQRVLMAVVVCLKTDEGQLECVCSLPDDCWLPCIVRICVMGQLCAQRTCVSHTDKQGDLLDLYDHSSPNSGESHQPNSSLHGHSSTEAWELVSGTLASAIASRASTCRELALDSLATLLEHKMRTQSTDAWNSWMTVVALLESEGAVLASQEIAAGAGPQTAVKSPLNVRLDTSGSGTPASEETEQDEEESIMSLNVVSARLLHRALSLVLQRLARSSEGWTSSMLPVMHSLVSLVRNAVLPVLVKKQQASQKQRLYKQRLNLEQDSKNKLLAGDDSTHDNVELVSCEDETVSVQINPGDEGGSGMFDSSEAEQALFFLFDCFASLRKTCNNVHGGTHDKSAKRGGKQGHQAQRQAKVASFDTSTAELLLMHGLRVTLSFLKFSTERNVDRITNEVLSMLVYFINCNSADLTAEQFQEMLLSIFSQCQVAISAHADAGPVSKQKPGSTVMESPVKQQPTNTVNERIMVLVFTICHQFIELRHTLASDPDSVCAYVLPTLDAMIGIDTCIDVDVIFRLVEVKLCTANTISFEELPDEADPEDKRSNSNGSNHGDAGAGKGSANSSGHGSGQPNTGDASYLSVGRGRNNSGTSSLLNLSSHSNTDTPAGSTPKMGSSLPPVPQKHPRAAMDPAEMRYLEWLTPRQGVHADRVTAEILRIRRQERGRELGRDAVGRHWRRVCIKLQSEALRVHRPCQWKLGVAHEGGFHCRKRVVVRPQYNIRRPRPVDDAERQLAMAGLRDAPSNDATLEGSLEDLGQRLAQAVSGHIADVRR